MTSIPAGIAAEQALTRQAIALETVKKSAEADRAIANILTASIDSSRGSNVNISV